MGEAMSETQLHSAAKLLEIWQFLEHKNKCFHSDIRVDAEAVELLTPFCDKIGQYKGMYISGFNLNVTSSEKADVTFTISSMSRTLTHTLRESLS
ncbi:hypothetical protein HOU08_gp216 [Dickeya phage vB_DsoM_JA29]|uniref:Uncharacterized protein n=1 Tax=Dickeya phage vB_DsoM_JA29 TaxID=2283031 RepID=A0A384ZXH7_9CAUD|nr:hypothetical protein HOU08_gp216 [Dickeya phage vB_DsoM_JA29]AXG66942.1 hypothetical protein JA29_216 [Dickeya phage vB_DsoM_JA29]